jgi:hypothetical protein
VIRGRHISGYTGAFAPPESAQEGKEELETTGAWPKILQTRGHDFEVFDPRYAGVILE